MQRKTKTLIARIPPCLFAELKKEADKNDRKIVAQVERILEQRYRKETDNAGKKSSR